MGLRSGRNTDTVIPAAGLPGWTFGTVPMGYGDAIASILGDIARGRHSFSNGRAASDMQ
jgi:hypothetical protein